MPETQAAYLALGGNIGDVSVHFSSACRAIAALPKTKLTAKSRLYRTKPWGITEQPNFLNACVKIETELMPEDLLERLLKIEKTHHRDRKRSLRWGPRPLDIDILLYADMKINTKTLKIPHPEILNRPFVLIPLSDIAPDVVIAGQKVSQAASACDGSGVTLLKEAY
jgi:2-amino-4-hydroxy-6-hydroxymethyldihydropteridine diphosphokinase